MRPLIILCKCSCRLAALACSQLAIIASLPARLASLRHVHMWALPHVLAERYHDTVRVQTRSRACDLADLSSSCANVPAGLLHLHALSSRSSDCMPRVFTRMRRVPAGLKTRRSRLRAARRRCPAAACMPVLLASCCLLCLAFLHSLRTLFAFKIQFSAQHYM